MSNTLITGDSVSCRGVRNTLPQYDNLDLYIHSIEKMISLRPSHLITGHFPIMSSEKEITYFLEESINYVDVIQKAIDRGIESGLETLREIADYVCKELGKTLTPQGLITVNTHLSHRY